MKCDELKVYVPQDGPYGLEPEEGGEPVEEETCYLKSEVDAVIVELKQKLQDQCISCPVKMQEDDVVAEKDNEIRRLKRALYKAIANWAHHRVFVRLYTNEKAWENVESKCRAKAEQYK